MCIQAYDFRIDTKGVNCNICLAPLCDTADSLVRAPCEHLFHAKCFNVWRMTPNPYDVFRQKNCTICRAPLEDAQYIKSIDKGSSDYSIVPGVVPSVPPSEPDVQARMLVLGSFIDRLATLEELLRERE